MTSSIKESSLCSPDSTVSSLLTSYSTDSNNPYSNSLIHYKDKLYSSASEALEAYIEDFDLSLTSSEVRTGKICIFQSTPKQVKFSKHHAKEKHGMSLQICCLVNLISLATDDLLALPADGSLPFVQRTPFKSRHQSSEWNRRSLKTSFCPYQTSSLNTESGFSLQENGKLEPLTSTADRGLEISTENLSNNLENHGSPSTTDILEAERSWENAPGAFKPPVPVCCEDMENALPFPKADIIHKFLEDCLNDKNKENTFSGGHHQRPLEALKLMLFKLQEIQASLNQNETAEQKEEIEKVSSQFPYVISSKEEQKMIVPLHPQALIRPNL
uniref:Lung adenoma susceptibility protein 2 n=1 Tax=Buteo japonicus TaxID=224669 RepID=A0A8C0BC45_9AVES